MADRVPEPFVEILKDLAAWLDGARIPAVIVGGVAAAVLGRPRATRDIDALAIIAEAEWPAALAAAERHGIGPRIDDPLSFARRTRVLLLRHLASGIDIDVILGRLPFEEEAVSHGQPHTLGGVRIMLPRVEDLLIMKAVAQMHYSSWGQVFARPRWSSSTGITRGELTMSIKGIAIGAVAAFVAAAVPAVAPAQGPAGGAPRLSVELQALNPPIPEDMVLSEERRVPAERKAAASIDPDWEGPRTSWGHPSLEGTWSTDDMRAIPMDRAAALGTAEYLDEERFIARARQQQAGSEHSENVETFHRNSWGIRSFGFSSLVVDPPDGRTPALTADGRARAQAVAGQGTFGNRPFNAFEDFNLYDRCVARGLAAGMGAVLYGNGIQISQSPNAVAITYEMIHETRVIPLDDRPHLDAAVVQYGGNGRGRWEGDTLVIEATGFKDNLGVAGAPPSPRMRTVERLRRIDPEMIEYRITIDDPETWTAPFTARIIWTVQPGYTLYEYSCHEGNYAVGGGLAGEREHERRVAEAVSQGLPPPRRSTMNEVYGIPPEETRIFDINKGE